MGLCYCKCFEYFTTTLLIRDQAGGDATKHEPPNTVEFDGVRDGRSSVSKPRGRTGPRSSSESNSASDPTTVLLAAMLPIIANMSQQRTPGTATPPSTPTRPAAGKSLSPSSPIPVAGTELHACLVDFHRAKGIDLIGHEGSLAELDLTPDILSDIPVTRLGQITGAVEGKLYKLQAFCKEWSNRLEVKRQNAA